MICIQPGLVSRVAFRRVSCSGEDLCLLYNTYIYIYIACLHLHEIFVCMINKYIYLYIYVYTISGFAKHVLLCPLRSRLLLPSAGLLTFVASAGRWCPLPPPSSCRPVSITSLASSLIPLLRIPIITPLIPSLHPPPHQHPVLHTTPSPRALFPVSSPRFSSTRCVGSENLDRDLIVNGAGWRWSEEVSH